MTLIERIKLIERIHLLIKRKGTGSPSELASKLEMSERNVYNLINFMKNLNAPIYFCTTKNSYCYEKEVEFAIGFITEDNKYRVKGGKNLDIIATLSDAAYILTKSRGL